MEQVSANPVVLIVEVRSTTVSCDGVVNCDALHVFRVEGE